MDLEGVFEQEGNDVKSLRYYPIECLYHDHFTFRFTSALHWHFFGELIYVHEGEHEITIENETIYIKKGDVLYINPQRIHIAQMHSRVETTLSVIKFDPEILFFGENRIERQIFAPFLEQSRMDYFHLNCLDVDKIDDFFSEILYLRGKSGFASDYEIKNTLCILMVRLLYLGAEKYGDKMATDMGDPGDELLYSVVRYINRNFENEISTDKLLKLCGMSYSYFAKKFKRYTGKTLIQYINHVRIAKAQRLLGSGDMSIIDVATSCGFNDASYFVRVFKQLLGKTPSEYRNSV